MYWSGLQFCTGIFLDKDGPTFIKKSLIFSQIIFISAVYEPSFNLNFSWSLVFLFLLITLLIIDQSFF